MTTSKEYIEANFQLAPKKAIDTYNNDQIFLINGGWSTVLSTKHGLIDKSRYLTFNAFEDKFLQMRKTQVIEEQLLFIANAGWNNYYHWVYQSLQSALYALHDKAPRVAAGPPLSGYQREYLDLIEIEKYIEIPRDTISFLKDASYNSLLWGDFVFCPNEDSIHLFNALTKKAPKLDTPRKIYISRKDSPRRRVLNEDAIEAALESAGYTVVTLSGLSVVEQISLFRTAHSIVASHGAGLTNLVYARPGTKLIEIIPSDYVNRCFWAIAISLGITYKALLCTPSSNKDISPVHDRSYKVDMDLLASLISEA